MPLGFVSPIFRTGDIDATIADYAHAGFTVRNRYDDYLMLERDHVWLSFWHHEVPEPTANVCRAYVYCTGVDEIRARLHAAGVGHVSELGNRSSGLRDFLFVDRFGNTLLFGEDLAEIADA